MKPYFKKGLILFSICFLFLSNLPSFCQKIDEPIQKKIFENRECFKCHGGHFYYYYNDWVEKDIRERMNPHFVIDSTKFYKSNHKTFACIDCHSYEYEDFPHSGSLRMEPIYSCMDCHGGDENSVEFNFEQIEEDFINSIHSNKHGENFTCWMCHDPHTYEINARTKESIVDIVEYANNICLNCHTNVEEFQILTDKKNPDILDTHNWLPNQSSHFKSVRCIECHTEINDSILVAHKILPKDQAVKKCVECHSTNSLLMASLYKYQRKENRNAAGFINAAILKEAYIIGANRNIYLNWASIVIFGFVILGICAHTILRIIKK